MHSLETIPEMAFLSTQHLQRTLHTLNVNMRDSMETLVSWHFS